MNNVRDKIKKLLNLANNAGATEAEASRAMELASALMLRHGIEANELKEGPKVVGGAAFPFDRKFKEYAAAAAARLYGTRYVVRHDGDDFYFAGRPENVEASNDTFLFIVDQVERLYKINLPKGLSKAARAEFRRTFKEACALRVYTRASNLMFDLERNNEKAKEAVGSTALVVANHTKVLRSEIDEWFKTQDITQRHVSINIKDTSGSRAGRVAGDLVDLNKKI